MIEPRYGVLQTLFADRVFRIPHYQRFYSWHRRQREDLFADLRKLAQQEKDQHHFMATIVCYRTPETKEVGMTQYRVYDIVDGQQRLTTLIILLKCIELTLAVDDPDRALLGQILVKRDGHLILLQTNNANERIFNRFIREGVIPSDEDLETYSDENLADAIRDCSRFVREWVKASGLAALLSLVLHRLGFVVHDTEDSRAVYTVFEVLNSRGLEVDWLDKSKSMLMGRAFELATSPAREAEIGSLQGVWGQIYREIAKQNLAGEEILRVTATLYYGTGASKPLSAETSLDQIRNGCSSFDKPRQVSERVLDVTRKLAELQAKAFLGPVTDILHPRILAVAIMSASGINEDDRQLLLEQWERITFRIFGLNGKDARTKVGEYVRLAARIVGNDSEARTFNQIMTGLRGLGSEYPIDTSVVAGLSNKNCYEESPDVCRYVLWKYEEHLAQSSGAGATVDEHERANIWKRRASDSIEHVFPQTPWSSPTWAAKSQELGTKESDIAGQVGRIGNLILLPIALNQEARTKPFQQKKEIYEKHNLRMIRAICEQAEWSLGEIAQREAAIVEWAKTQWADV
jgi:hypothetical protein